MANKTRSRTLDVFEKLAELALPVTLPDPIVWLEQTRRLSPESSREVGPFSFARAPYMVEPQRAILSPGGGEVVIMWSSQTGKSELALNSLLYWSVVDPGPGLCIQPDWKAAQSFTVDRIRPMLRDAAVPRTAPLQDEPAVDNIFHLTLGAHMPLTVVHASGSGALSMRPIRFLVFDEVSRYPATAKGRRSDEGDPIGLARIRTTTFGSSAKVLYTSSPVEAGQCRISELYGESTQERWHSRCPRCGSLQILRIAEMDFESATCRCLACGESSGQDAWQRQKGEWIAENPSHHRRGFWTNCFSSPFVRWPVVFQEYRSAVHLKRQGDYATLRVVLNTRLAETYTPEVELLSEPETLLVRREDYDGIEVPDSVRVIVGAIDSQASWLEWLACGIAPQGELFLLDRGQVEGRLESDAQRLYEELDTVLLSRRWRRSDGKLMPLFRCFQDAAGCPGATGIVHRFCHQRSHVLSAYIGRSTTDIVGPWKRTVSPQTHGRLFQANVSHYKQQLADKLGLEPGQPGSIHFGPESRGFDEEFFLQLLSEHKEIKLYRGTRTIVWKRVRDRNEGLDLMVMVLCLLDVFRSQIDQMDGPQLVTEKDVKPEGEQPEPRRSTWGAQPVNVADPYIQALQTEQRARAAGQQRPSGMRFGVQNPRGVEW